MRADTQSGYCPMSNNPVAPPISDPAAISAMLRKCSEVCASAETLVAQMDPKRNAFLTENLADAVQQLDLILRVLDDEESGKPKNEGRTALLKRFFHRSGGETQEGEADEFEAPAFNVSRQGLQGNSWSVPMTELLNFLSFGRKTGVLWVDSPNENYLLGIADGKLLHGSSDNSPEGLRIGEVLVGFGFLTRRQLDRFISNTKGGTITGESLLKSGMITVDELRHALVYQVQQLFIRLATQQNAIFRFREGLEVPQAYQVSMDISQLLLSTAQIRDEMAHKEVRGEAMQESWNSWTSNLSDEVSKTQESETTGEPTAEAAPEEEVKDAASTKETTEKAAAGKESTSKESTQCDDESKDTEIETGPKSTVASEESTTDENSEGESSDDSTAQGAKEKEASTDEPGSEGKNPHNFNGGGKRKAG